MKHGLTSLVLISILAVQGIALQNPARVSTGASGPTLGRWQVKFTMAGVEKNLILVSKSGGVASFMLLDTGPDDKPVADPQPAAWAQLTNNRVSFSGEVELPIGTCCREIGTLIFKGKLNNNNSMSGILIFVTSIDEDESPYKFRTIMGDFTATRVDR